MKHHTRLADPLKIVAVLAKLIEQLLIHGELYHQHTKFHALKPPQITIKAYLERIERYAKCSPSCLVVSLIYIDRLCQHSMMSLSLLNIHRLIITSICAKGCAMRETSKNHQGQVAAKFLDDSYYPNLFYSQIGGITLKELNFLEVEFLFGLNFSLHVTPLEYRRYYMGLNPMNVH